MYLHSWEMLRMQLFNQKTYFFLCQGACPKFEPILQIAIFFQKLTMYKFLCQVACPCVKVNNTKGGFKN